MLVVPALRKLRQDHEFKAILGYIMKLSQQQQQKLCNPVFNSKSCFSLAKYWSGTINNLGAQRGPENKCLPSCHVALLPMRLCPAELGLRFFITHLFSFRQGLTSNHFFLTERWWSLLSVIFFMFLMCFAGTLLCEF